MRRKKIAVCLSLWLTAGMLSAQVVTDSNWVPEVRTVMLNKNGVELEPPVLTQPSEVGSQPSADRLLLRFDVMDAEIGNYRYQIRHCDSRWQVDDMEPYEFMTGFAEGPVEGYNSSFTTTVPYVNYYQYLPGANGQFLMSGNYAVFVTPQDYPDSILLSRRFYVTEEAVKVETEVTVPYDNMEVRKRREVDVYVKEADNGPWPSAGAINLNNPAYVRVVVQQNGRTDLRRELPFAGYERNTLCYRHRSENVFAGGNTFRWFDISNIRTAMYNVCQIRDFGGEWYALLCPLENRARKPFMTEKVLNGGMKVNVWDRTNKQTEADYVWVNFALPVEQPYLDGNIYVVGDLTQWHLGESNRMQYNPDMKTYTLRLPLKQGYYAYQLLFEPVNAAQGESMTARIEGDHYETVNTYYVYVYYRSPAERYDRLVGYRRIEN